MRKRFLFVITALALTLMMLIPSAAFAGAEIQDTGKGTVSLDSQDGAPEQANGTAKFTLKSSDSGTYKVTLDLDINNLPERAGKVYQVWLQDTQATDGNNGGTGFNDPWGAFQTDNDGDAQLDVTKHVVFFAPYDEIVVSTEERNDEDPSLNGLIVLRGDLN